MKYIVTVFMGVILVNSSMAAGLKKTTVCQGTGITSTVQFELSREVVYGNKKSQIQLKFDGSLKWDAEVYKMNGDITDEVSSTGMPVSALPGNFVWTKDKITVSQQELKSLTPEADLLPVPATYLKIKVPQDNQYVVLKLLIPSTRGSNISAFGSIYITDKKEKKVTKPDGGSSVSFICEGNFFDI